MSEPTHQLQRGRLAFPRLFSLPRAGIGAAYLVGYVLLDWISFIHPYAGYNITPWNPPTGLSFVLVLAFGRRMIPYLFVAPLLADLMVRQLPLSWALLLSTTAIIGSGYSLGLLFLMRPKTRFSLARFSLRDLFLLLVTAAVTAAVVASTYVGAMIIAGLLPVEDFFAASLRFWVGDMIGIAVVAPFGLMVLTRRPLLKLSLETAAQFAAILMALVVVFRFPEEQYFQLFYVAFLPIIWMAVRTGLPGVTAGILVAQLGLIISVQLYSSSGIDVTAFQALMLILAITGLVSGAIVTERRRTEYQLRLHQQSLAQFARLRSMGELAAAVAHEINQPLMAAGTYSRLVSDELRRGGHNNDRSIVDVADRAAEQVERASEVVRRLRALVRPDKGERAPTPIDRILNDVLDLCQPELSLNGIGCQVSVKGNLPPVKVDLLQIEQVILNLIRNAMEAMNSAGATGGVIVIEAQQVKSGDVELIVRDTGPGFPEGLQAEEFPPFATTKATGLGIGLSLSRTIIEAHGGQLTTGGDPHGAIVKLTLPTATKSDD
jgi:two-component system, LuxR family, sensor kinase FixL